MAEERSASRCQSCDASIVFVPSAATGKPMPLNAEPETRYLVRVPQTDAELIIHGSHLDTPGYQVAAAVKVYTSHFATCPDAAAWRGKGRAR